MRPAKITFPGEDQEKLENIARVSLKIADKVSAPTPISPKKRRKSAKNDPEDVCQKQCMTTKYSPVKDNEDNEKTKSKGGVKFPVKTDKRKVLKRVDTVNHVIENKKMRMSQCKSKREKKAEENESATPDDKGCDVARQEKTNEPTAAENENSAQQRDDFSSPKAITDAASTSSSVDNKSSKYYIILHVFI